MLPSILLARLSPIFTELATGQAAVAEAVQDVAAYAEAHGEARLAAVELAAALRQRFAEGWHIRNIEYGAEVALTLGRGDRGERHSFEFDGRGTITDHRVEPTRPPAEPRVYPAEQLLIQALATEVAPLHVYEECGVPAMYFDAWTIAIDADDFWVVERSVRGGAARRLLADTLADAIVRDVADSGGAAIDYRIDGAGASYLLHVERDASDHIVAAELRQTPERRWGGHYQSDGDAFARAGAVERIVDGGRILVLAGGDRVAIEAFVADDLEAEDTGCGC